MTVPVDLVALAAHPDDAEIGCGGALLLAVKTGGRVAIADLTDGEAATRGSSDVRERERRAATEILGVTERRRLGLPDGALGTSPAHRLAVIGLLRDLRPRVVLAPHPEDRHPDHAAAGKLAREASFLSALAAVGEGSPHRPDRLYHYMVHTPFTPSFVVDVSDAWDRKMAAVRVYESQFGEGEGPETEIGGPWFVDMLEARGVHYGSMIGVERGEPYHQPGPLPFRALPGLEPDEAPPRYHMFQ